MYQQLPQSNSYQLASLQSVQQATPFYNNQIRNQSQTNTQQGRYPMNQVAFSQQNQSQVIPNILQNKQQTENQQNLAFMQNNNNNFLNNYPINLMNNQQSNLNNLQNNYLNSQNLNLGSINEQQNMLQLQMMNNKYKQIIQQQQQQLKQLQIQQQLQQAQAQITQQQQQQQQFNQIYSQTLPISLTNNSASLNDVQLQFGNNSLQMLQNQVQNNTASSIKSGLLNQYNQFSSQLNPINGSISNLRSQDVLNLSNIKLEISTQIPKQDYNQQQSQLSNQSSPQQISTKQQQQSPLLNSKQDALSIATTQSGQHFADSLSQTNITQMPQFSFQTSELNQKLQNQINSQRQTSFSTSLSKLDEELNFESQSQKNKNDSQKRKHSIALGSRQNNFEGDSSSYSYLSQDVSNKNQEVINKKRFLSVKQEEGQAGVMSLNIPQSQTSISTTVSQENISINNFSKLDSQYQEFAKMSSFDNLQESSKAFDKLLNKLSVSQTVELILSTLPSKPEEQTNFENKFVGSMKAKQSKDKRNPNALYMTRFHNLTRLLMYNIVQLFSFDILSQNLNVHFYISQELENICRKIKQHARQTCNGQFKTDFYTHSHYNGLFLTLDKNTISHIKKSPKDIEIHEQVFGVNLLATPSEQLDFEIKKCNFFKVLAHEILMKCSYQSSESSLLNGDDARRIYFRRALSGISKLNKGQIVHRF